MRCACPYFLYSLNHCRVLCYSYTESRLRSGLPGNRRSNAGRQKRFFPLPMWPDRLWIPQSLLFHGNQDHSSGIRPQERQSNHSRPFSADIINICDSTSAPPYTVMACTMTTLHKSVENNKR